MAEQGRYSSRAYYGGLSRPTRQRPRREVEGEWGRAGPESPAWSPVVRRGAEGGSPRGLEEPGGGQRSSRRHRGPEWEPTRGDPEGRRKARAGSGERWEGSILQQLPGGDWGSSPPRRGGGKRGWDPIGEHRGWKEDSEGSGSFGPTKRRRRPGERQEGGGGGPRRRRRSPGREQDDWDSSPEALEDWGPEGGRESGRGGWPGRPAPAAGWVPREEVVSYWKRCQSLLPQTTKSRFLSTCPRPNIPDGSSRVTRLNWSILDALSSRQVLKVSFATRYSFASQVELMDMLGPAMALYEMAESAIEHRQAVEPLDVKELARRLIRYVGSLNQSFTMQRCSQVLGTLAPPLRGMTNQMSSRDASGLLFAEEKVKFLEDVILKSAEEEVEEVDLDSYRSSDREAESQDYTSLELWHRRFGHADSKAILQLHKHNLGVTIKVNPGDVERIDQCVICLANKGKKPSFPLKTIINSARLGDLIHCELCGPFSVPSKGKYRYALIFVDDFSRYCITYVLKRLGETQAYFRRYLAMLSKFRAVGDPKAFQFNSAGESVSCHMKVFLEQQGIPHKSGVKEKPGQSRSGAQEVASLLEMTRCMLADAHLPNQFWDSAITAATYLLNRLPVIGRKKTPFQIWQDSTPSIAHIRVFGSQVCNTSTPLCLAPYIFTGYDLCHKGYRVIMNLETGRYSRKWSIHVDEHKRVDRRWAVFAAFESHDAKPLLEPKRKEPGDDMEDERSTPGDGDGDEVLEHDEAEEASGPPSPPEPGVGRSEPLPRNEPATWEDIEEMSADEAKKWHGAAREEIESLRKNATWTLTELPPGKHAVGCKWVFKVKPVAEGEAERYTARLVLQKPGEDVDATAVTPDVKLSTTRMLLSVSASKQMQVKHLEVKTASLLGEATEELYMEQPPGFVDQKRPDWVCKLKKGLRGPKEASRGWNGTLEKILLQRGFKQDEADRSLYRRSRHGRLMFILACAGDVVVASQHKEDYEEIAGSLGEAAEVKELGDAAGYLGSLSERPVDGSSVLK